MHWIAPVVAMASQPTPSDPWTREGASSDAHHVILMQLAAACIPGRLQLSELALTAISPQRRKNELVWTEMEGACSICQLMNEVIPGEPITAEDTGYQHARGVGCSRGYGLIMALRACPKAIHACFRTAGADI